MISQDDLDEEIMNEKELAVWNQLMSEVVDFFYNECGCNSEKQANWNSDEYQTVKNNLLEGKGHKFRVCTERPTDERFAQIAYMHEENGNNKWNHYQGNYNFTSPILYVTYYCMNGITLQQEIWNRIDKIKKNDKIILSEDIPISLLNYMKDEWFLVKIDSVTSYSDNTFKELFKYFEENCSEYAVYIPFAGEIWCSEESDAVGLKWKI